MNASAPLSALQALKLATKRSTVPLIPAVGPILFFTVPCGALHPWASFYANQLRRRKDVTSYLITARHLAMQGLPPRPWTDAEARDGCCAAGIDLDLGLSPSSRADRHRALQKVALGTEIMIEADADTTRARVVLVDMCPLRGFSREDERTSAPENSLRFTMEALQTAVPLLHRDVAVLCRLPQSATQTNHIYRGIRDVFSECRFVVKTPDDGTNLLLATKASAAGATHGTVKRGWELYHRNLVSRTVKKHRPFGELAESTKAQKPKKYFVQALRSRNLELVPPAQVAHRQLEAMRSTMQRDRDSELLNDIGTGATTEMKAEAKTGPNRNF